MLENELIFFQQEIGQIKQELMTGNLRPGLNDEDSYKLAAKIDLTISRLVRMLEGKSNKR